MSAKLQYIDDRYIQWVAPDGTVREPKETKKDYPLHLFHAAGKPYISLKQLQAEQFDEYGQICRDIYGRDVFAVWERFPCFDSYDYLHEHRYYHWYLIREGDKLTCVYYEDEKKTVEVTEDVRRLEYRCCKEMQDANWQAEET